MLEPVQLSVTTESIRSRYVLQSVIASAETNILSADLTVMRKNCQFISFLTLALLVENGGNFIAELNQILSFQVSSKFQLRKAPGVG